MSDGFALHDFLAFEKEQRRTEVETAKAILRKGQFPTTQDAKETILRHLGEREEILSCHIFWKELKVRRGLESLLKTAAISYADLCKHEAALVAHHEIEEVDYRRLENMIVEPFHKDVFAFCASAVGAIDATRRIKSCRPDLIEEIDKFVTENFRDDVSAFVRDLRKNLLHGSVVVPGWEVSSDQDSRYGKLKLSVWELLEIGKWTKESVNFLNKSPDKTIDLRKTIDAYNQKLNKYSRFISNVLAVNVTTAERDYFDIVDECSRLAKRQWFKIVAQILKGKNPYDYLHYTFQDYEVRQIMRLPRNSRQQIDLIISLKSAEVECDEELRRSLYHLFQVSDT